MNFHPLVETHLQPIESLCRHYAVYIQITENMPDALGTKRISPIFFGIHIKFHSIGENDGHNLH